MSYRIDPERLSELNLRQGVTQGEYEIVVPPVTNMAADTIGRWAREAPDRTALIFEESEDLVHRWSFAEVEVLSNRLASALAGLGVGRGDRVAVHTGMRPETAFAHMAIYKLGAIAVTLSQLYGPDTLEHALNHSSACAIITQDTAWGRFRGTGRFSGLTHRVVVGEAAEGEHAYEEFVAGGAPDFTCAVTGSEEAALLMYTSGSTGLPKGILHGHRILQAYIPSLSLAFNLDRGDPDAVFWSPADWAWVGGLLDLLLIGWAFGNTVLTSEHRFDADWSFGFMARHNVTHSFQTPTALKRLAQVQDPLAHGPLALRVVITGGEALPSAVLNWAQDDLGIICNEFYGLTEINHLVGCCQALFPSLPGSMGQCYPGHATTIVDPEGNPLPDGEAGEIVARADDQTHFLGYWQDAERTNAMRLGEWVRTGDLAVRDANGYFWYKGRTDDLIKSAGYRIGPAEVEDCLVRHPAVAEAAVVGSPDPDRGSIVKAFIRLAAGHAGDAALVNELQEHVKTNLAVYKYPREIEFVEEFEMTSSAKISRKALRELEERRKSEK
jgi:acetyl-CoA synthetase